MTRLIALRTERYTYLDFCRKFVHWWRLVDWIRDNPNTFLEIEGVCTLSPETLAGIAMVYGIFRDTRIPETYATGAPRKFSDEELLLTQLRFEAGERMIVIAAEFGTQSGHTSQVLKRYKKRVAINTLKGIEAGKTTLAEIQKRRDAGLG